MAYNKLHLVSFRETGELIGEPCYRLRSWDGSYDSGVISGVSITKFDDYNAGALISIPDGLVGYVLWSSQYVPPGIEGGGKVYQAIQPSNDEYGNLLPRILGLGQDNWVIDDTSYDERGNLLLATLYVYNSAANATLHDKATGLLYRYDVSGIFSGSNLTRGKRIRSL